MPVDPSEPEKYSIDDMMDRLKNSSAEPPEAGELVTRADGTQAIRVRKKKRRTSQPHKQEVERTKKSRIVQISAVLVLLFLTALVIGSAIIYANSSPFRKKLESNISNSTGANIALTQFRMNPKTANAGSLTLTWPEGNALQTLTLGRLNAEIFPASFLGKSMTGEEVSAGEAILQLRIPSADGAMRLFPAPKELPPIRFNRYHAPIFHAVLGEPAAPLMRLVKSEGSFLPFSVNGRPQLSLYQGDLLIKDWPKLRVDRSLIEFRDDSIDISHLRILHGTDNRGSIEISGSITPKQPDQLSSLDVKVDAFDLSGITGVELSKLISGRIETTSSNKSNFFSFHPKRNASVILDLTFTNPPTSGIQLQGFPFLFTLAKTLDDRWFENPTFQEDTSGVIHREAGVITLSSLRMAVKGRMAVRGQIKLTPDQSLSGTLQIGLTQAMIATAPNQSSRKLNSMFSSGREGYRWLDITISGTATAPTDNFDSLYESAAEGTSFRPGANRSEGSSFDELTRPKSE